MHTTHDHMRVGELQAEIQMALHMIEKKHGSREFVALHGRIEDDFTEHCNTLSQRDPRTALAAMVGFRCPP